MRQCLSLVCLLVFTACSFLENEEDQLRQSLAAINKKCPVMVDSETRLDSVHLLQPERLRYSFTLVNTLAVLVDTAAFRAALWPGLLSNLKVSREMATFRERKMIIEYEYADGAGKKFYLFSIRPSDYENP